jgi:aryl-alcohol dehydrogenase-like predicted oxidoreductase
MAAISHARSLGINFFGTAHAYGFGRAERVLGRALAADLRSARDAVVIATKGGLRMDDDQLVRDASPARLRKDAEASLDALGTPYIDLYQVDGPDPGTPIGETAAALAELIREGLIRHVGVANYTTEQIAEFAAVLPVETVQPPYHLFRRDIEASLLPYAQAHDIGVLVYGPIEHGLLGFRRGLAVLAVLRGFAADRGATIAQLAVAWLLAHPAVQVAIVGSSTPAHLEESLGALDLTLSEGDLAEIDSIMAACHSAAPPRKA